MELRLAMAKLKIARRCWVRRASGTATLHVCRIDGRFRVKGPSQPHDQPRHSTTIKGVFFHLFFPTSSHHRPSNTIGVVMSPSSESSSTKDRSSSFKQYKQRIQSILKNPQNRDVETGTALDQAVPASYPTQSKTSQIAPAVQQITDMPILVDELGQVRRETAVGDVENMDSLGHQTETEE